MNLIDAWKQAKEGQRIRPKDSSNIGTRGILKQNNDTLLDLIEQHCIEQDLLADDWEIVKGNKVSHIYNKGEQVNIAIDNTKVTLEWDE